jgi:hypothetical protein
MDEFRKIKAGLFEKYGDKIITGTEADRVAILADLKTAARFAKVPADRLLTALAVQYVELSQPPHEERARVERPTPDRRIP